MTQSSGNHGGLVNCALGASTWNNIQIRIKLQQWSSFFFLPFLFYQNSDMMVLIQRQAKTTIVFFNETFEQFAVPQSIFRITEIKQWRYSHRFLISSLERDVWKSGAKGIKRTPDVQVWAPERFSGSSYWNWYYTFLATYKNIGPNNLSTQQILWTFYHVIIELLHDHTTSAKNALKNCLKIDKYFEDKRTI